MAWATCGAPGTRGTSACRPARCPYGSTRATRIPAARAPTTSVAYVSPRCSARDASMPMRSRAIWNIAGSGFSTPTTPLSTTRIEQIQHSAVYKDLLQKALRVADDRDAYAAGARPSECFEEALRNERPKIPSSVRRPELVEKVRDAANLEPGAVQHRPDDETPAARTGPCRLRPRDVHRSAALERHLRFAFGAHQ